MKKSIDVYIYMRCKYWVYIFCIDSVGLEVYVNEKYL